MVLKSIHIIFGFFLLFLVLYARSKSEGSSAFVALSDVFAIFRPIHPIYGEDLIDYATFPIEKDMTVNDKNMVAKTKKVRILDPFEEVKQVYGHGLFKNYVDTNEKKASVIDFPNPMKVKIASGNDYLPSLYESNWQHADDVHIEDTVHDLKDVRFLLSDQ